MQYRYLQDAAFLKEFDRLPLKQQYVKVTILNWQEKPLQEIQGRVISGTYSANAQSIIRRSCNLSFLASDKENDLTNVDSIISINKKAKLEVGFLNTTDKYSEYEYLWFPLGIYIIDSPSISHDENGVSISLSLKDKMCLLNGDFGGVIPAAVTFSSYDTVNGKGEITSQRPTIYRIVQELVNHFGGEQLGKIIITDLPLVVKQIMRWSPKDDSTKLYISDQGEGGTGYTDAYVIEKVEEDSETDAYLMATEEKNANTIGMYRGTLLGNRYLVDTQPSPTALDEKVYVKGDDVGYIYTDFTYPGELACNPGQSVCDVLNIIVNTLGNYEYFYDIYGNFVFREIKNYVNTTKAKEELENISSNDYLSKRADGKSVYSFTDGVLVKSFSNSPQYDMIKNDFVVWGLREDTSGSKIPIRYHLAIDKKPEVNGQQYQVCFYKPEGNDYSIPRCPIKYNTTVENFPTPGNAEFIYADLNNDLYTWIPSSIDGTTGAYIPSEELHLGTIVPTDWRTLLLLQGAAAEPFGTDSNYYYPELKAEWCDIYKIDSTEEDPRQGFRDGLTPSTIDYFLDFIDTDGPLNELSVENIGRRQKVVNDNKINCVFEPTIPDFVFIKNLENKDTKTAEEVAQEEQNIEDLKRKCDAEGQPYALVGKGIYDYLATGINYNSAFNAARDLLNQHVSYNESISISALPIYYLEPNSRISVYDKSSGINGDYMINSISIPLDVTGTMTLSCTRVIERM